MISSSDIQRIIKKYERRLSMLLEKKAEQGISVDPAILTEIDDINQEISKLWEDLRIAQNEEAEQKKLQKELEGINSSSLDQSKKSGSPIQEAKAPAINDETKRQNLVEQAEDNYDRARDLKEGGESTEDIKVQINLAIRQYEKAIELTSQKNDRGKLWFKIGLCYDLMADPQKAENAYSKAVGYCEDHTEAWLRLGDIQNVYSKTQAFNSYKQYLKINPGDEIVWRTLASMVPADE